VSNRPGTGRYTMLSEMLYASHGNDTSRKDDHGLRRCAVNGCDALQYGSPTCHAHSNNAQWDRVSRVQNQMSSQQNRATTTFSQPQNLRITEDFGTVLSPSPSTAKRPPTMSGDLVWTDGERSWPHQAPTSQQSPASSASRNAEPAVNTWGPAHTSHSLTPLLPMITPEGPQHAQHYHGGSRHLCKTVIEMFQGPRRPGPLAIRAAEAEAQHSGQAMPRSLTAQASSYRQTVGIEDSPLRNCKNGPHVNSSSRSWQKPATNQSGQSSTAAKPPVIVIDLTGETTPPPEKAPQTATRGPSMPNQPQPSIGREARAWLEEIAISAASVQGDRTDAETRQNEQIRTALESGAVVAGVTDGANTPDRHEHRDLREDVPEVPQALPINSSEDQGVLPGYLSTDLGTDQDTLPDLSTDFGAYQDILPDTPAHSGTTHDVLLQGVPADSGTTEDVPLEGLPADSGATQNILPKDLPADSGAVQDTLPNVAVARNGQNKSLMRSFDSDMFDTLIYQQEGAALPPKGVATAILRTSGPVRRQQAYLSANPLIHRPYTRSKEWSDRKSVEIRSRPRRKAWFGKAAERQRWLWAQQEASESRSNGKASRRDPQPWSYGRPMDYGDVPADQLPADVLRNPAWVKACAWHREMRQKDDLRRVERQKAVQQTQEQAQQYLRKVLGGHGKT
jgi:hypothetical protein